MSELWLPGELNIKGVRSTSHWRLTENFSEDGGATGSNMAGTWAALISPDPDTTATVISVDDAAAGTGTVIYSLTPSQLNTLLNGQTRRELLWQVQLTRNSVIETIRWGTFEIVKGLA